ncbi:MAG TPA: ABC transporter permease [Vicinamibacterales bacterium]|nr:ABC transporter permease [Vicinamibacterales bacterium]
MSLWRQVTRGWRALTRPGAADDEVDHEIRHFLEEAEAAYRAQGMTPDEARRAARLDMGAPVAVREEVRSHGWEAIVSTFFADVRYAARQLRRAPGFALASVFTIALGIGASTAIYSAIKPTLLEPLSYPDPHRLITIWDHTRDGRRLEVTFGTYRELAERCQLCESLAVTRPWQPTLTGPDEPERLEGQFVTADYFRVFGVLPALGSGFQPADDRPGGRAVVILSNQLWRRVFNPDRLVIGRDLVLDGMHYAIVGVMPAGFSDILAPDTELWSLLQYNPALPGNGREWGHHLRMVGRFADRTSYELAAADLDAIARNPLPSFPRPRWAALGNGFAVSELQEDVTRSVRPALVAVMIAVSILLAIACVNATSLLLARAAQRRGELALRAALGAGRPRLVRQLVTESLLLVGLGGALGLLIVTAGIKALVAITPPGLPRVDAIAVDATVFAFTFGLTAVIGLAVSLLPALRASSGAHRSGHQESSRQATSGHRRLRRGLVVAQVALALVLLVGAGLLLRSLQRLFAVPTGFESAQVVALKVQVSNRRFDAEAIHQRFGETLAAVRAVRGVAAAALTSHLPFGGELDPNRYGIQVELRPDDSSARLGDAYRYAVSPGYFEAMGIALRRGRSLDERDTADAPLSVVISESLASRRFPDQDPIGQRIHVGPENRPWYTIVGIVGDVKQTSLAATETDAVYVTTPQWHFADNALWIVVRTAGDAGASAAAIREAIWSVDRNQPIVQTVSLEDLVALSAAERSFALVLFQLFGLVALVLAATGAYGVLSEGVTERTREMGVRLALGASRQAIVSMIVREGTWLAGAGIALGLGGAIVASRALTTLLFGVSRLDAVTYVGVIGVVLSVTLVASAIPAWRAARVDPSMTLRS